MLKVIFDWFFGGKPTEQQPAPKVAPEVAPYKVEAPAAVAPVAAPGPAKCGCGRSASGFCVGLHALSAEDWAKHKDNPNKVKKAPTKPRAEKKPAAAIKTPAKSRSKKAAK